MFLNLQQIEDSEWGRWEVQNGHGGEVLHTFSYPVADKSKAARAYASAQHFADGVRTGWFAARQEMRSDLNAALRRAFADGLAVGLDGDEEDRPFDEFEAEAWEEEREALGWLPE